MKHIPNSVFINYVNSKIEYHSYDELVELTGYTVEGIILKLKRLNLPLRTPITLKYKVENLKPKSFINATSLAKHFKCNRGNISSLFKKHPELKIVLKDK